MRHFFGIEIVECQKIYVRDSYIIIVEIEIVIAIIMMYAQNNPDVWL